MKVSKVICLPDNQFQIIENAEVNEKIRMTMETRLNEFLDKSDECFEEYCKIVYTFRPDLEHPDYVYFGFALGKQ